jgi:hypothetical protein
LKIADHEAIGKHVEVIIVASHGAGEGLCAPVPRFPERKDRLGMRTI